MTRFDKLLPQALSLAGVQASNETLARTLFERRFKWATSDVGSLEPAWDAFMLHTERLKNESEYDLVESMRDQCTEATRLLESIEAEVSLCRFFLKHAIG